MNHGIPHGGWCPKGRKALDGPLNLKYHLTETPSDGYLERTEWNVRDSDATAVFTLAEETSGGSLKTITFVRKHWKPFIHLHRRMHDAPEKLVAFLARNSVYRLNVAGS